MTEIMNVLEAGRIETFIDQLATSPTLPVFALAACLHRLDDAAPILRGSVEKAANGETLSFDDQRLLFRAVHVLGGGRDHQTFAPLNRLLRRAPEELDTLFGDALAQPLPKIIIGVFDGDSETLLATAANPDVDESVRGSMIGAATFLTWEGRIDPKVMRRFLERFDDERLAPSGDFTWYAWGEAISLLGWRPFLPRMERAFADGRIVKEIAAIEDLVGDLEAAERQPSDQERFQQAHLGYIDDVVEELEAFPSWTNEQAAAEDYEPAYAAPWIEPYINPWRDVGRNDPCPCGSGRKAKKCCLGGS